MERLSPDQLARLETAESEAFFGVRGAQGIKGAFRNRAVVNNATPSITTPSAASSIIFAIAQLTAKASGIFGASVSIEYQDSSGAHAAADTYTFTVTTQTGTGAVTLTNGAPVTNGENVFVSNNAAGMTISAGGGGSLIQTSDLLQLGVASTATVAGQYSWSGIVWNSITSTSEVPFTLGNNVFLCFALNASAHVPGLSFLSMSFYELP